MNGNHSHLTFLDLFCGCGGFSLGLERAGFRCLAAIDFNPEAVAVFKRNFPHVSQSLERDLTAFPPAELAKLISQPSTNNSQPPLVDVIVGGPPCQGFSTVRQVDGANSGKRMVDDDRRLLYRQFLRYVEFFHPKVFVMENVLGIRSASGGEYFTRVQKEARTLGYRVHTQVEECIQLGLPQKRRRQLFIGTRLDLPDYFRPVLKPAPRIDIEADGSPGLKNPVSLWEAIADLPRLNAGGGTDETDYDAERFEKHLETYGGRYLLDVLEVDITKKLTAHRARPHSERDLRDFTLLKEGESSAEAMRRGVEFEFPYDKENFKDRYTRQHRMEPCSTIVAHLSKDGLMFIHPTQNRSLTAREAARIQSFPDWFEFPIARTHQFRVIGNAVPPLVGEAVGLAVKSYLQDTMKKPKTIKFALAPLPQNEMDAVKLVLPLLDTDARALRKISTAEFKRAWFSIAFIYMGLHPDGALDNGKQKVSPLEMMTPDEFRRQKWVHKDNWPNPKDRIESMMTGMRHGWIDKDLDPRFPSGAPIGGWAWSKTDVKPGDVFYVIDGRQLPRTGPRIKPGTKPEAFAIITRVKQSVHEALVVDALAKGLPVSAAAVDEYSIHLPEGYIRKGDVCFIPQSHKEGNGTTSEMLLKGVEPRLYYPYFERSGWPVVLAPVAKEAWRRFRMGEMKDDEFYCSEAQMAGICHRNPEMAEEVREEREKATPA